MQPSSRVRSPWPRRFALATAVLSVPLVLFGGSVTTMGAGLAVDGWLNAEGHFLPFFPAEKWFRDADTFVEHTHRLFGMLVGLAALATVAATFRCDARRASRALASAALFAVCAQGALGGLRVLEKSPELAFLHGAFGQLVFALLCVTAAGLAPAALAGEARGPGRGVARAALAFVLLVGAQVVAGAWYRHGLRPEPAADAGLRFALHALLALVVLGGGLVLGERLRASSIPAVSRSGARLELLLLVQVLLGLCAWAAFRPGEASLASGTLSVLHVLGGALLLGQCAVAAFHVAAAPAACADGRLGFEHGGAS